MTPENKQITAWAREEHQEDLSWIQANQDVFFLAAGVAHEDGGLGAVAADTTRQLVRGLDHPFGCFSHEQAEETADDGAKWFVRDYNPTQEIARILLKQEDRTSTFHNHAIPPEEGGSGAGRS